jgi:hypothetical protein
MLDSEQQRSVRQLQLYLDVREAQELREALAVLLEYPDASEHRHVLDRDGGWELSLSLVTEGKLRAGGYTPRERELLAER